MEGLTGQVMTVTGPITQEAMGLTLPHEHIMVDFIGAERTGKHRYDPADVIRTMQPALEELVSLGVRTFVDCTPMYLARDATVFQTLSKNTGLQILTNTGQYKEPYLPRETFELPAEAVAEKWCAEWAEGIEGTRIRPGFVKTAVNPEPLAPVQQKVIRAAALTSARTGFSS